MPPFQRVSRNMILRALLHIFTHLEVPVCFRAWHRPQAPPRLSLSRMVNQHGRWICFMSQKNGLMRATHTSESKYPHVAVQKRCTLLSKIKKTMPMPNRCRCQTDIDVFIPIDTDVDIYDICAYVSACTQVCGDRPLVFFFLWDDFGTS